MSDHYLAGGPSHGRLARLGPFAIEQTPWYCVRPAGGTWGHYVPVDGELRYVGPCADFDHDGRDLEEPCCGHSGCDGR